MKWVKRGLVYAPENLSWARHSALTPTPILKDSKTIRVYAGFRDGQGASRIGYVDLDAGDPMRVLRVSRKPALDVGCPGTFDDNGVILGDVIRDRGRWLMYYVGFQRVEKVKFLAFSGLAVSSDGGDTFKRVSRAPVMDRSDRELYIRAVHTVMREGRSWVAWCGVGSAWQMIDDKPYPIYNIKMYRSKDGRAFPAQGHDCIDTQGDEYRIGRPRVYKKNGLYKMFYTKGTLKRQYLPGYAESSDGRRWTRMDEKIGIAPSATGWDSEMLCYPSLLDHGENTYMFYNGNNYGKTGFGLAVLAGK